MLQQSDDGLYDLRLANCRGDIERQAISEALKATGGRKAAAARLLGISRKTLWEKLKLLGDM